MTKNKIIFNGLNNQQIDDEKTIQIPLKTVFQLSGQQMIELERANTIWITNTPGGTRTCNINNKAAKRRPFHSLTY
ncbi:hypothetical protein J2T20_003644 [Paenibacillus wynnii]|nr:hypothetical protein [Paenibacillus wynnii]